MQVMEDQYPNSIEFQTLDNNKANCPIKKWTEDMKR